MIGRGARRGLWYEWTMHDEPPQPSRRRAFGELGALAATLAGASGLAACTGTAPSSPSLRPPASQAPANAPRFALGVASGQPRATSVVLWTRLMADVGAILPPTVSVNYELAEDEGFRQVVRRGRFEAQAAWAHSVHADVEGLQPARWYWYRFEALGQRSPIGRTRTAPARDAVLTPASNLRLAIASCQRFDVAHYAAWRHLSEQSLDAVLFLGDYIYESGSGPNTLRPHIGSTAKTLDAYRQRYAQYKSDGHLQAAHAACPWWIVWDDHEVDNDYAADQSQSLEADFMARRAAAYQAYWEHMPFSMAQRPLGPAMRIVDRFQWGRLATLHLLDDRQHRDPQACPYPGRGGAATVRVSQCPALQDPQRSLLGQAQERWLTDGWDSERPWNLVGQQTMVAPFRQSDDAGSTHDPMVWTDGWDGYPQARQRLIDGIHARKLGGAVILGGDVHTHYVASLHRDPHDTSTPVVASEFVGTSISSRSWPNARVQALMPMNPHVQYGRAGLRGAIVFDINARRLQAQLLGVDDPLREDSAVRTLVRYVVEAGRPGPVAA
jgi:alkaline phosphatase D